jgi:Transposase DDE domain
VIPLFGYKNHLGIDRRHGFIRTFAVTDAAAHEGRQLGRLLDPGNTASPVWAVTAYRSAANQALLARRGLVPQFQRPKPRAKPMPPHIARGNASRARVRAAVEHVFAAQKCRLGLVIHSVGLAAPPPGSALPTWSPTCAASSGSRPGPPWPEPARSPNRSPDRNTNVFDRRQTAPNARSSPQITSTNRFFEVSSCSVHPTPRAHSIRKLLIPYWTTRKL